MKKIIFLVVILAVNVVAAVLFGKWVLYKDGLVMNRLEAESYEYLINKEIYEAEYSNNSLFGVVAAKADGVAAFKMSRDMFHVFRIKHPARKTAIIILRRYANQWFDLGGKVFKIYSPFGELIYTFTPEDIY